MDLTSTEGVEMVLIILADAGFQRDLRAPALRQGPFVEVPDRIR